MCGHPTGPAPKYFVLERSEGSALKNEDGEGKRGNGCDDRSALTAESGFDRDDILRFLQRIVLVELRT